MSKTHLVGFLSAIMSVILLLAAFGYLGTSTKALASTSFSFTSCPNPGGSVVASYANGLHWIVGNGQLQQGSDVVFSHGNNTYTQCYCPLTANNQSIGVLGTQTDWIFSGNISSTTRQSLINSGWVSVADGSAFGLSSGEYLARNNNFQCGGTHTSSSIRIFQSNNANITNHVSTSINTGVNRTSFNTSGSTTITTGNASSSVTINNSANSNIVHISQQQTSQSNTQISNNGAFSSSTITVSH